MKKDLIKIYEGPEGYILAYKINETTWFIDSYKINDGFDVTDTNNLFLSKLPQKCRFIATPLVEGATLETKLALMRIYEGKGFTIFNEQIGLMGRD